MARDRTRDSAWDWWMRSRETGKITIGQAPNLSQKLFQRFTLIGVLLPRGRARGILGEFAVVSLAWWSVDEIVRGVNPFRRVSGAFALASLAFLALRRRRP
jgi:hypothetical protein